MVVGHEQEVVHLDLGVDFRYSDSSLGRENMAMGVVIYTCKEEKEGSVQEREVCMIPNTRKPLVGCRSTPLLTSPCPCSALGVSKSA